MDALSKIFDDIHLNKSEYLYLKAQGDWCFQYQDQSAMVAYAMVTGHAIIQLDATTQVQARAGDLILIPSGQSHTAFNTPNPLVDTLNITHRFDETGEKSIEFGTGEGKQTVILAIRCHMDSIMARPLLNALPHSIHLHQMNGQTIPEWLQIGLQFLAVETLQVQPGRDKILDHLVSIFFIECVRDYILQLSDSNNWLAALSHPELSNALAAIHGQPQRAWTVETLAEQCCMSRSKFAQLFSQIVGETPLAYLQQHRLRIASQYLRQGQYTIQQIAHLVGYASETAFSQTFKKQFDLTPTQYRQQFMQ
ncbi:AraC family transcriptional regulator [Acinetobacter tandoii]|jgi:AraC-like DNA-binding protein|uniref:AraC family transcriptional regulator n=1 Tax=Acinetobacter tandoii TaxID=202954 RepID=UPI004045D4CF